MGKISSLTADAAILGTDVLPVVSDGATKKVTVDTLAASDALGDVFGPGNLAVIADGVTDQASVINAALAAGGAVRLPVGDVAIGSSLLAYTGTKFYGQGIGHTNIIALDSLVGQMIINADTVNGNDDIVIADMTLDANRTGRPSETQAVLAISVSLLAGGTGYCDNVHVRNVEVKESNRLGIQFSRVRHGSIQGCSSHDHNRDGITLYYDCSDVQIEGNQVYNVKDDMIGLNAENLSLSTTGDITTATSALTCASVVGAQIGDGIMIAGAGAASADLFTTISNIVGSVITIATPASTTVDDAVVRVGTVGHAMKRITVNDNILGGTTDVSQTAGSCVSACGVQDSVIANNICTGGYAAGITVANWNTTAARNLIIEGNVITTPGLFHSGTDGIGILVAAGRTVSSYAGKADCDNIKIRGNSIDDARYYGIRAANATGTVTSNIEISGNTVKNSGRTGANNAGISIAGTTNQIIIGNRCYDDQGSPTQTYGIGIDSPLGSCIIANNNCNGNATGTILPSNMTGLTYLKIEGNPNYTPFAGIASLTATWTDNTAVFTNSFYKNITVTFAVPFPTGVTPIVTASCINTAIGVSVVTVTNTGFTARLFVYNATNPGSAAHSVHWRAVQY